MERSRRNNPLNWRGALAVCFGVLVWASSPTAAMLSPPVHQDVQLTHQPSRVRRNFVTFRPTDSNSARHLVTPQPTSPRENNVKKATNLPELFRNPSIQESGLLDNVATSKKSRRALEKNWRTAIDPSYTDPTKPSPLQVVWLTPDEKFNVIKESRPTVRSLPALYEALGLSANERGAHPKFLAPVLNVKYLPTEIQFETSAFISVRNLPETWYRPDVAPPGYAQYVEKTKHQRFSLEGLLLPSKQAVTQWNALRRFVQSHEDSIHTWSWSLVPKWFFWIDTSLEQLFLRYPLQNHGFKDVLIANSITAVNWWLYDIPHQDPTTTNLKAAIRPCRIPEIPYYALHFSKLLFQFGASPRSQKLSEGVLHSLQPPDHTEEMEALKNLMKKKQCVTPISTKSPLLLHSQPISAAYVYSLDTKECGRWQWCYEVVLCGTSNNPCGFATCIIKTWLQLPHKPRWEGHRIVISDLETRAQQIPSRFLSRFLFSDASKQYAITLETSDRRL